MEKDRLQAFSDGVIAILITIMVLELKIPHGTRARRALRPLVPVFLTYVLSFVYLGIYWNNHHHLLPATRADQRRGPVGEPAPAVLAVAVPVLHRLDGGEPLRPAADRRLRRRAAAWPAIAYYILQTDDHRRAGPRTRRSRTALGRRREGQDLAGHLRRGDPARVREPLGRASALYVVVALMWLVPDRRIESRIQG